MQTPSTQGGGTHLKRRSFPPPWNHPPSLATANPNGEAVQGKDISPLGEELSFVTVRFFLQQDRSFMQYNKNLL